MVQFKQVFKVFKIVWGGGGNNENVKYKNYIINFVTKLLQ